VARLLHLPQRRRPLHGRYASHGRGALFAVEFGHWPDDIRRRIFIGIAVVDAVAACGTTSNSSGGSAASATGEYASPPRWPRGRARERAGDGGGHAARASALGDAPPTYVSRTVAFGADNLKLIGYIVAVFLPAGASVADGVRVNLDKILGTAAPDARTACLILGGLRAITCAFASRVCDLRKEKY
jgi:hypothetical protein